MFLWSSFGYPILILILIYTHKWVRQNNVKIFSLDLYTLIDRMVPTLLKSVNAFEDKQKNLTKDSAVTSDLQTTPDKQFRNVAKFSTLHGHSSTDGLIIFDRDSFLVKNVGRLSVMLTFGAAFPPLAVCGCIAICSHTFIIQLLMGKYIEKTYELMKQRNFRKTLPKSHAGESMPGVDMVYYDNLVTLNEQCSG